MKRFQAWRRANIGNWHCLVWNAWPLGHQEGPFSSILHLLNISNVSQTTKKMVRARCLAEVPNVLKASRQIMNQAPPCKKMLSGWFTCMWLCLLIINMIQSPMHKVESKGIKYQRCSLQISLRYMPCLCMHPPWWPTSVNTLETGH